MRASVLIPTHNHASTLPLAVASVLTQGVDDLEVLIVGDGVDDATREAALKLAEGDIRVRFFDYPKGPRMGEVHRDTTLRQANGRNIYYQSDDDIWLPGHLTAMEDALAHADFVGALHTNIDTDERVRCYFFGFDDPQFTQHWPAAKPNALGNWVGAGFGLSFAAHTREAYNRLPEGWATTPEGFPTDLTMWHKFLREPWCRMAYLPYPVALHFRSPDRLDWSQDERVEEVRRWAQIVASPGGVERVYQGILAELRERLLRAATA